MWARFKRESKHSGVMRKWYHRYLQHKARPEVEKRLRELREGKP